MPPEAIKPDVGQTSDIPQDDWEKTPASVKALILRLLKRIEDLEARLGQNSQNSNRPPSSDSPYQKPGSEKEKKKGKVKSRKGHKGHRQQMLEPTETRSVCPQPCTCGCDQFVDLKWYYTHQHIELPEIVTKVIHFDLYSGKCSRCGKVNNGSLRNPRAE